MYEETPEWLDEQRRRWLRPDADRYLRPDADRYMKPEPFDHNAFIEEFRAKKAAEAVSARAAINPLDDPSVRRLLAELKHELMLWRLRRKYRPDQPRVAAGNPEGGQWTSDGGGAGSGRINDSRVVSDASGVPRLGAQYAELRRPGIGHNNPPPDVPEQRPPTSQERHRIAREVARRPGLIGGILAAREWLRELGPSLDSYNDPPKTFEELQQAATEKSKPGYNNHHIVLQAARHEEGRNFPESWIDSPENIVSIPRFKHWDIHSWYEKPDPRAPYNGRSPREYLRGKDWDERYNTGLDVLRRHGVLKP
jgi:hypothetical protein